MGGDHDEKRLRRLLGVFRKGGMLPGTTYDTSSDSIDTPATWTFVEGAACGKNKIIKWVRTVAKAPSAADALGTWLKDADGYINTDPWFSMDIPGGWTVTGGDQPDKIASDKFTLTPQAKVSYDYGTKPNALHASVAVYTASDTADVPKLQALLAAQPSDTATAPPVRTMKQINGHDYLSVESTTLTNFSWNSYLPSDTTVYVITFEGPSNGATPARACYTQMMASFRTNTWQPILPTKPGQPAPKPTPTTTTTPATRATPATSTTPVVGPWGSK